MMIQVESLNNCFLRRFWPHGNQGKKDDADRNSQKTRPECSRHTSAESPCQAAPEFLKRNQYRKAIKKLRVEYNLDPTTLTRIFGVTAATLANWETTGKVAKGLGAKIQMVESQLRQLSQLMAKDRISSWLTTPNATCVAAGSETPLGLIALGRFDKIEQFIYLMGSGTAF